MNAKGTLSQPHVQGHRDRRAEPPPLILASCLGILEDSLPDFKRELGAHSEDRHVRCDTINQNGLNCGKPRFYPLVAVVPLLP